MKGGCINNELPEEGRFVLCGNSGCKIIFLTNSISDAAANNYLCTSCRRRMKTEHLVQCSNCESIIDFIQLYEGEEAKIFYTLKCHNCVGSVDDETNLAAYKYPNLIL